MHDPRAPGGPRLILASGSPRRRDLLDHAGLTFDIVAPDIDEPLPDAMDEDRAATEVMELARAKARAVAAKHAGAFVLGADTIGLMDGRVLTKPADATDARAMLTAMSGRKHTVLTGIVVVGPDGREQADVVTSDVTFRALTAEEIDAYVATGEPMGKAGAYAIQGEGRALVDRVDGPWDNVVGLPVTRALGLLAAAGHRADP